MSIMAESLAADRQAFQGSSDCKFILDTQAREREIKRGEGERGGGRTEDAMGF